MKSWNKDLFISGLLALYQCLPSTTTVSSPCSLFNKKSVFRCLVVLFVFTKGDKILDVAGQNVERFDSRVVQTILDSVSDMSTVKVSRPLHRDAVVAGRLNSVSILTFNKLSSSRTKVSVCVCVLGSVTSMELNSCRIFIRV